MLGFTTVAVTFGSLRGPFADHREWLAVGLAALGVAAFIWDYRLNGEYYFGAD